MSRLTLAAALAAVSLGGCTMAPSYVRPAAPVPTSWPTATAEPATETSAGTLAWREVFQDQQLQGVIDLALRENRDLRVAIANIQKARAEYGVQRSNLLPAIDATGAENKSHAPPAFAFTPSGLTTDEYSASVGFTAYELDLFGRVRSLNKAALETYFATEDDRRTAQISLVAEVATDYLTLAAEQDQLDLARNTLKTREASEQLTGRRFDLGAASQLDLRQAQTLTEQSRSDVAAAVSNLAQARNALRLVVGADVPDDLMPHGGLAGVHVRQDLPPGLPSQVLTRRPDVQSAEHALKSKNADIGAARAAFFPKITLTGSAGSESASLNGLFAAGTGAWNYSPQISLPIFAGGANVANLHGAEADRDVAVAQYEKAVQTAFREVADALAVRATIQDQIDAQEGLVAAASDAQRLSQARYDRGVDSYLNLLDAQRTLYSAQQSLLNTRLTEATNRVTLYKALGGGAEP